MKMYQKVLVLMLIAALILVGATACGKSLDSQGNSAEAIGNVDNTAANDEGSSKNDGSPKGAGNEKSKYLNLLNKSANFDNYYTQFTQYGNMAKDEVELWRKGDKLKIRMVNEKGQTYERYVDLGTSEVNTVYYISENEKTGMKSELMDGEAERLGTILWFGLDLYLNRPDEHTQIVTTKEEDFNGVPCIYIEMKTFENEVIKWHVNKENGVVMNYELIPKSMDEATFYSKRHAVELGTVSDEEFEIPAGVEMQDY
ncbi:MAG: hypothetical protein GX207_02190 [Peptococcaceae bacterium]|nr:hypothetical protein [Peptococcaceae bacterium]